MAELEETITAAEVDEWMAFARTMPFGERGAYWRHGVACALLANLHRDPKKSRPFKPADFMPFGDEGAKPAKSKKDEAKRVAAAFKAAFGGRVVDARKPKETTQKDGKGR